MPTGIYKRTKKWKWKTTKNHRGMTGKKHTEETIKRRTLTRRKNGWWKDSGKTERKISEMKQGKKRLLFSDETKRKMSESHKGEKAYQWKGGVSKVPGYNTRFRRKIMMNTIGSHTLVEWELLKKQYNYRCPCCGKSEPEIKLTEDHIIPLSRDGSDYIKNIQPLCRSCNSKKYNKIIKYEPI